MARQLSLMLEIRHLACRNRRQLPRRHLSQNRNLAIFSTIALSISIPRAGSVTTLTLLSCLTLIQGLER